MKKLMMTTAILAMAGTTAMAQDSMFRSEMEPTEIRASEFIGMRIYSSEQAVETDAAEGVQQGWEDIGEVNDVILSRDGQVDAVLVDIGGFLGIGERQVAVDMSSVRFVSDSATADNEGDFFLVMNATRANLEEAPAYGMDQQMQDQSNQSAQTTQPAGQTTGETTQNQDTAAAAPADGQADAQSGENVANANGDAASTTQPADQSNQTAQGNADATRPAGQDNAATAEQSNQMAQGNTDATRPAGQDNAATADQSNQMAQGDAATREPIMREGYDVAAQADLTTEMLTGAAVYDANDEWIGEVSELLVNDQGNLTDAVIDVGGFLGIGEKPVRLAMDDLDILRQQGGNDVRIYVSMTEDQLEAMPTYED